MLITILKNDDESQVKKMLDLLASVDNDFLPPLSSRESSSTINLNSMSSANGLQDYLNSLRTQKNYCIMENDKIIGLASIRENHRLPDLPKWSECEYLTTIAVLPQYRRQGLAIKLYKLIFTHTKESVSKKLVTRTWHTNYSHINLTQILGFKEILRIKDHRMPGLDTIYLGISFETGIT